MLEAKKKKSWIVWLVFCLVFFLIGLLAGGDASIIFAILGAMFLIITVAVVATDNKAYKKRMEEINIMRQSGRLSEVDYALSVGAARVFEKLNLVITPANIVDNGKNFAVVPRADVQRAFRSNMVDNKYDMDNQFIALYLVNGTLYSVGCASREGNQSEFTEALRLINTPVGGQTL